MAVTQESLQQMYLKFKETHPDAVPDDMTWRIKPASEPNSPPPRVPTENTTEFRPEQEVLDLHTSLDEKVMKDENKKIVDSPRPGFLVSPFVALTTQLVINRFEAGGMRALQIFKLVQKPNGLWGVTDEYYINNRGHFTKHHWVPASEGSPPSRLIAQHTPQSPDYDPITGLAVRELKRIAAPYTHPRT